MDHILLCVPQMAPIYNASREDPDQPVHPHSLINALSVRQYIVDKRSGQLEYLNVIDSASALVCLNSLCSLTIRS